MRCGPLVGRAGNAGGSDGWVTVVGAGAVTCAAGWCALVCGFVVFGVDGVVGDAGRIGDGIAMPGCDTGGGVRPAAPPPPPPPFRPRPPPRRPGPPHPWPA